MAGYEQKGQTLPYNEDVEKAVLGSILLNANTLEIASENLRPGDFYHTGHQKLFQALLDYAEQKQLKTLDFLSITNFLDSKGILGECGGAAYIASLTENVTNTASVGVHASTLRQLSMRRSLIRFCSAYMANAYDMSMSIQKVIDEGEAELSNLSYGTGDGNKDHQVNDFITQAIENIQERMQGASSGAVETGFDVLDNATDGGFRPTDFIIIAARPSIGKTAFATSIIQNMVTKVNSAEDSYSVAFYSLEMSGVQVCQRLMAGISRVPLKIIRNATFAGGKDRNFNAMLDATNRLYDRNLFIFDTPNMKLSEIRASARRLKREKGLQAMFIDYIGLIDAEMDATVPRFEQVASVSRSLKSLARELEIPVVVLCQVSRDAEGDKNEPQLNNLRDSGAIEQDADVVMFLHRVRKFDSDKLVKDRDGNQTLLPTKLIIAKQRNGETGEFKIGFRPVTASFENIDQNVSVG